MDLNNEYDFDSDKASEIDIKEILFRYLRYWVWIVLSAVFFLFLGYIYLKFQTPQYNIESDLLIQDNKANLSGASAGASLIKSLDLFSSDKIIDNEIEILKSY